MRTNSSLIVALLAVASSLPALAQSQVVEVKVHSPGLEGNLLGDSPDQAVAIYLPAAYRDEPQRRFATLYFLHGFADTPAKEVAEILQVHMDKLLASRTIEPMIVVAPNGLNRYLGSFYVNSEVTGNWEDYIVRDVVHYADTHYRTVPAAEARGVSGHSMGGYGALMLAFKHPDVFGNVYAMSPCCTVLQGDLGPANTIWLQTEQVKSADELVALVQNGNFLLPAMVAMSAAFAPAPKKTPLFGQPPFVRKSARQGEQLAPEPEALARFQSKIVVPAIAQLLPQIHRLKGIYIDYGAEDEFSHIPLGAQALSAALAASGVPHTLEVYEGNHGNHVNDQIAGKMLPWFSKQLKHGK